MTDFSSVLIVIPTLNEARHIETCIRSLIGGHDAARSADVVVADGGSNDGTRDIVAELAAEFPNLQLVHNPERLQSAGINRAVQEAARGSHSILIRCDAHSSYPSAFIACVAGTLQTREAASVVVPMDACGMTGFARAAAWVVDTKLGSGGSAHRGGRQSGYVDHGHHAAFDLGWFRKLGGYDPRFSHNEDAEYDKRLADAGGSIWLEAGARISYQMRPSLAGLWRQYLNYGRGRARTVKKHRMRPRLRQLIPVINLTGMALSLIFAAAAPLLLLWPALYVAALLAVSVTGALRLRSAEGLWAGPALAAIHNAWAIGFIEEFLKRQD